MCVHVCVCECTYVYTSRWRPEVDLGCFPPSRSTSGFFFYYLFFETALPTETRILISARLASLSALCPTLGVHMHTARPGLYVGAGDLNSVYHAFVASTLRSELSPQS